MTVGAAVLLGVALAYGLISRRMRRETKRGEGTEEDDRREGKARQSVADWVSQETGAAGRCYQSIPESTLEDAREWHFAPEPPSY
jgi:hypothetical protein